MELGQTLDLPRRQHIFYLEVLHLRAGREVERILAVRGELPVGIHGTELQAAGQLGPGLIVLGLGDFLAACPKPAGTGRPVKDRFGMRSAM